MKLGFNPKVLIETKQLVPIHVPNQLSGQVIGVVELKFFHSGGPPPVIRLTKLGQRTKFPRSEIKTMIPEAGPGRLVGADAACARTSRHPNPVVRAGEVKKVIMAYGCFGSTRCGME